MALKFMADKAKAHDSLLVDHTLTSAREICDQFNTPFDTTAKVMQVMNNHDLLKSTKGIKGGYTLNRELSTVTYMDLVRMIEGKVQGRVCVSDKGTCELFSKCNIITPVVVLNRKLNLFLENLSLEELLKGSDFNPLSPHTPTDFKSWEATQ